MAEAGFGAKLSRRTVETLIDLVANKLCMMELRNRWDPCDVAELDRCLQALKALIDDAPENAVGEPAEQESMAATHPTSFNLPPDGEGRGAYGVCRRHDAD